MLEKRNIQRQKTAGGARARRAGLPFLYFAAAGVLSCAEAAGVGSPFGVAFAAAACRTGNGFAAVLGTFAGYLMRLRIKEEKALLPKFLLLYLQSHQARIYIENKAKSTSGVHNINSTEISDLQLPLYEIEKQYTIINAIESRLSVCDSIEQTVDLALQQAEAMRQSILKDAFEGRI